MAKQIFINFSSKRPSKIYGLLYCIRIFEQSTIFGRQGKCMVWSENIFVMIMTHEKFATFATKPIADTKST